MANSNSAHEFLSAKEEEDEGDFFIMRKPSVAASQEKSVESEPSQSSCPTPQTIQSCSVDPVTSSSASADASALVAAAIQAVAGGIPSLNTDIASRNASQSIPLVPQLCLTLPPIPAFTVSVPQNANNNPINPEMKFIVLPVYQCWGCRKEFTDVNLFYEHVNKSMCLSTANAEAGASDTAQLSSDTSTSLSDGIDISPDASSSLTKVVKSSASEKHKVENLTSKAASDSIDAIIENVLREIRAENIKKEADCEIKVEIMDHNESNHRPISNDSNDNNNNNNNNSNTDHTNGTEVIVRNSESDDNKLFVKHNRQKTVIGNKRKIDINVPNEAEPIRENEDDDSSGCGTSTKKSSEASHVSKDGFYVKEEASSNYCPLDVQTDNDELMKDLQIVDPMEIHAEHPARLTKAVYSCLECTAQFHTNIGLLRHQSGAHGAQQFACSTPGCSKVFKNESALSDHKKRVHGPRSFACAHCNAYFTTETYLKAHIKIHMDKKHVCRECNHGFVNKTDLNNHMRVHTGVKPYTCKVCGKAFRHVSGYYTHVRIHTGETPYECEFCHKKFTNASNFQTHRKIHTQDKKFKCEICDKEFIQQSNFTRHKRTHTKERPYECSECGENFSYSTCLKKHLKKDHGVEPLECDQCKRTFLNNSSFVRHRTGCQFKDIVKKEAETDSAQFL